jgi:hypothetical protein
VHAVVELADRRREKLGARRRHHEPAAGAAHEARRLAVLVGGNERRPADGEDAVEPARDHVAGQAAGEPHDVDVRRRERER